MKIFFFTLIIKKLKFLIKFQWKHCPSKTPERMDSIGGLRQFSGSQVMVKSTSETTLFFKKHSVSASTQ